MNNQEIVALLNQPLNTQKRTAGFSHFNNTKADMQHWLEGLHAHNMADISKQIRTTLVELAHLDADPQSRLELIEMMRLGVHNLIRSLNRHYLSQSLVLDAKGVSIAALVQQIRAYSFAIYNNITQELSNSQPEKKSALSGLFGRGGVNKLPLAIHRTINELSGLLYETKLLYLSAYTGIWGNLNQLYTLAEKNNMLGDSFDNTTNRVGQKTSIKNEYMRAVLLSLSQTNRLRQTEIKSLYEHSENWAALLDVSSTPSAKDLFLIDLNQDTAPMYLTTSSALSGHTLYLHTDKLSAHLSALGEGSAELLHPSEKPLLKTNMVSFVAKSISEPLERSFARHALDGKLQLCMGLIAVHYHLAGRRQFGSVIKLKELMQQEAESEILIDKSRYQLEGDINFSTDDDESTKVDKAYLDTIEVDVVNVSPGGYRVSWTGTNLPTLKTGEVVCLREDREKPWQVGIIRWVQQNPGKGADFGLEILSVKGTACGVSSARVDDPTNNYMRAILLPEVKSLNRPATIITPNFKFAAGHRIKIRVGTQEVIAKLGMSYLDSQSFYQYDFTIIANSTTKTYH